STVGCSDCSYHRVEIWKLYMHRGNKSRCPKSSKLPTTNKIPQPDRTNKQGKCPGLLREARVLKIIKWRVMTSFYEPLKLTGGNLEHSTSARI
ncbi:hypothetical protein CEXT_379251, partial [Caerostris extrusa]